MTLLVLALPNAAAVARAAEVFQQVLPPLIASEFSKGPACQVNLAGLSSFRTAVVFVNLVPDEHLSRLSRFAQAVNAAFVKAVPKEWLPDLRPFQPHATVYKTSANSGRRKTAKPAVKSLQRKLWQSQAEEVFGLEVFADVQVWSGTPIWDISCCFHPLTDDHFCVSDRAAERNGGGRSGRVLQDAVRH